jgi:hypothetical protein
MADWIQYGFIFLLFAGAVYYLYSKLFGGKKEQGCGKGCNCAVNTTAAKENSTA